MSDCQRASRRALFFLTVGLFVAAAVLPGGASAPSDTRSSAEAFRATARVSTASAGADVHLTIRIDAYTPPRAIEKMEQALEAGGSNGFTQALREAPVAGQLQVGEQAFTIRWAREKPTATGRVITLVTDKPVYFVGGGVPGAASRTGFDVAVLQLNMDSSGLGRGTMAAAARVKSGGPNGVDVDDYASQPIELVSVSVLIR
jgi:hypothetical protein